MISLRTRWAAFGAALTVALGGGAFTASASLGSGERPAFVPIAPCRLLDTRPETNVGPRSTPLGPNDTYIAAVRGANGKCSIPGDATGVALNVVVVNPSAPSYLTVFPADAGRPLASNLNWVAGQAPTPNAVLADLSADGRIAFYNLAGTVDIAVDVNGYFVDHNHDDRYYTKAQADSRFAPVGGASQVTVDSPIDAEWYIDMAIGADGNPLIAEYDNTNSDVKVAKCSNMRCTGVTTVTTVDSVGSVGVSVAIAVGTDGLPILSYYDYTHTSFKVAKCVDPACAQPATFTPIDTNAQDVITGASDDIAIAPDGLPVVVYESDSGGGLHVTKCSNQACTAFSTKTTNQGFLSPSLAFGLDGAPVISSFSYGAFDLFVTKCADAACNSAVTTPLDSADDVGFYDSIAVRPDGKPVVSYYDTQTGDLKVAACDNAACTSAVITTVDSVGGVGQGTSIVIGPDGNPIISYNDGTNNALKVATCGNPSCTGAAALTTVDSPGGAITAMRLGVDGLPVIAHINWATSIRVAKCASLTCDP